MGNIEKVLVLAIVAVIVTILAVAIWGIGGTPSKTKESPQAPPLHVSKKTEGETLPEESLVPHEETEGELGEFGELPPMTPEELETIFPAQEEEGHPFTLYVTEKGDTLYSISQKFYNDPSQWKFILQANPDINPDLIQVGVQLVIPSRDELPPSVEGSAETKEPPMDLPPGATLYTVQKGDSLYTLAKKLYGKPLLWKKIYEANKDQLPDPAKIPTGTKLIIPSIEEENRD